MNFFGIWWKIFILLTFISYNDIMKKNFFGGNNNDQN